MNEIVNQLRNSTLKAYEARPTLLREHYGIEQVVLAGGYGYRQVMELVQNGVDAVLEACEQGNPPAAGNRVQVILRNSRLYVANTGAPLSQEGLDALLSSHSSPKRGNQIGRFGLGFKSLLRLGGRIDLFTQSSGTVRFDPERCRRELQERFGVTEVPGLRLAWSLEESERTADPVLVELAWAETVVRAEIKTSEMEDHIRREIAAFPAEFLLFLPVTLVLELDDGTGPVRELRVESNGEERILRVGTDLSRWRVVSREVAIEDERARSDATHIHARDRVPLAWAIPLEGKREEAGRFWAFFPTHTPTYLPGILNAPWKLNSDRNAIIGGEWNTALMREAARLIVETLPTLSTPEDPGRPLDAFPRQLERKDELAAPLVEAVWTALESAAIVPDATGKLRPARDLWRHPRDEMELAQKWQELAPDEVKAKLVHPSCYRRQRGSRLEAWAQRLADKRNEAPCLQKQNSTTWFVSVASTHVERAVQVLRLAEAYSKSCTSGEWARVRPTLAILPTEENTLVTPEEAVLAPEKVPMPAGKYPVASALTKDPEVKRILTEVMQVKVLDANLWEWILTQALPVDIQNSSPSDEAWCAFWNLLHTAPETARRQFVHEHAAQIRVRRRDGKWVWPEDALLPGRLVTADDTVNEPVLIDPKMHNEDISILQKLGVSDLPSQEGENWIYPTGWL
ncbi:MAG: ATP-dependent helicase, partial [Chlorobi bacterium]|nr:ATP-dependent helicase [Chlorobiota bacterium]